MRPRLPGASRGLAMAVTFILGRAGTGKTRACLDALVAELSRAGADRRLLLLVPEQASFQMERALALRAAGGGYTRAEVLSFSRLAQRVLDETGAPPDVVNSQARTLLLRRIVAQQGSTLRVLGRAAATGGFFTELGRLLEELLREDVPPDALRAAAERLADRAAARKVGEVAQLYAHYLTAVGPGRRDAAARLAAVRARLEQLTWLPAASVWVDGFAGFTGQELAALVNVARVARDVTVTLLVDPMSNGVRSPGAVPDELGLFRRTERTYQRLLAALADGRVAVNAPVVLRDAVPPRFKAAPGLAALEAAWAAPAAKAPQTAPADAADEPSAIRVLCCATHVDELRAAARWIRALLADSRGTLRCRDFAVMARDLEPLAPAIAEVFAEYELPYFLDRRRPLRGHPLARVIPALLAVAGTDFAVQPVVQLLRTRLLPLSREQAERLENLIVRHAVRGVDLWRQPAWELERAGERIEALPAERARIVAAVEPLLSLTEAGQTATGRDWARALYAVLEALDVRGQVHRWIAEARSQRQWETAETHRLAWDAVRTLLDDVQAVLADTLLAADDVQAIVSAHLSALTLGLAPPTVDQVLVSAIERSRHPDVKYAWLLAFNEGVFPARPPEDTLLSTAEREALTHAGLAAPASHRDDVLDERLLAYIALTRPSHGLVISFATAGEDGGALLPSPLLADVRRAVPGLVIERPAAHPPPACLTEAAREYLALHRDQRDTRQRRRYQRVLDRAGADAQQAERTAWLLRGTAYENRPAPVGNYRRPADRGGDWAWIGSPSEIETFLQCPFKHFATYGLRLDPARGPQPLRWDLGSAAHEIMADVTRRALGEPGGVPGIEDERWYELLAAAEQEHGRRQPADLALRRPDFVLQRRVLATLMRDLVRAHAARWRRGRFEPRYCEQRFEPRAVAGALPSLELRLPDGQIVGVKGFIDRVDVGLHEGRTVALVYDYKSAAGRVGGAYLAGERLQLFTYLLAIRQALGLEPGGVLLAPLYPKVTELDKGYASDADEPEQTMYLFRPRGLFDAAVAPLLDVRLGTTPSPVAQMQLRKDGGFHKTSDAVPAEEIAQRLELARATILFAAEGVCAGDVSIAPLVEHRQLACRRCDFASVCRFERAFNRPRAADATLPRLSIGDAATGDEE